MSPIDPSLRIRMVRLAVADLADSVDFYQRVMGLGVIEREADKALLGADPSAPSLELVALEEPLPVPFGTTGLFHVAWLHPSRSALAETVRRVVAARWPLQGASDHGVSEALYLADPDGLGIEIYADRPRESWRRPEGGRGVDMVTMPLDLEGLLEQSAEAPGPAIAPGTNIGHVHLKVSEVEPAENFYTALGFEEQARMPGAAFVSAGGYHHHLGLNSWQSSRGSAPPPSAPGLRLVSFELGDEQALASLAERAQGIDGARSGENGELTLRDPDGQELSFAAARG